MAIVPLPSIIGMPPSTHISDNVMFNSMPIVEITPQEPNFDLGMTLFSMDDASGKYKSMVAAHGYTVSTPLKVAFLADSFPTDSFTNEYGENFLQKFTDFAGGAVSDIAQILNITDVESFLEQQSQGEGMMSSVAAGAKQGLGEMQDFFTSTGNKTVGKDATKLMSGMAKTMEQLILGAKVDFPQVWRGSSFSPSYSMTVRLYNPNPRNEGATHQYIVGPICALLCLCLPRSAEGSTYKWPFLHKIHCRGIYGLSHAYISNISIIKGGDQQNIAWNQRLSIVDVRLDFGSLYNSIIIDEAGKTGDIETEKRPGLSGYLDAIAGSKLGMKSFAATGTSGYKRRKEKEKEKKDDKQKTVSKNVGQEQKSFEKEPPPRKKDEQVVKMDKLGHMV